MRVIGLDLETQGLEMTTKITEIGAILYDYEPIENKWTVLNNFSSFVYEDDYPPQPERIIELTGITDEMLIRNGESRFNALNFGLFPLIDVSDIILAHRASYDIGVLRETCRSVGLEFPKKEILCTLTEFPWPDKFTCQKLGHLAWDHGILVHPDSLHRAINDVELMMRVVQKYDFKEVLEYAREPWTYLKADILGPWVGRGGDGGEQNGIAKALGFTYQEIKGVENLKIEKTWIRRIKLSKLTDLKRKIEASRSPFRVTVLEGLN